jgi:hypothetical protein
VTIKNNVIRNNISGRGAAIAGTGYDALIADNRIENNKGYSDHGGGVSIAGTGTITRNIFDGNVIDAGGELGYGWAGGLLVFNAGTSFTLSHNVYRNNSAPTHGGGVFVDDGAKVTMDHELLYNNKAKDQGSAVFVDAAPASTLDMNNCTIAGNSTTNSGGAAMYVVGSTVTIQNSIFWNNGSDFKADADGSLQPKLTVAYTLTQQGFTGTGNISSDPLFANAAAGDFHLKSTGGRFDPATKLFVKDAVHSPAIDAGNPASPYSNETAPNGGRINLGCYGNTAEASRSAGGSAIEDIMPATWTLFPNPAKETFTIGNLPAGSRIAIFDITGRKVYGSDFNNEETTLSSANFENGVYIIQVTANGVVASKKLVVSK